MFALILKKNIDLTGIARSINKTNCMSQRPLLKKSPKINAKNPSRNIIKYIEREMIIKIPINL